MAESFTTTNRYFDNKYYPHGFSHHDDLIAKGAQLSECHGYTFSEPDLGKCGSVMEEEKLFIAVCRDEREPVAEAECMQSKYMTHIKRLKCFHTLSGRKPRAEDAGDYIESDDQ